MKDMKLKNIVKYFDFLTNAELYVGDSNKPVWKGSMIYLHAAADAKENRDRFIAECEEDEDYKAAKKTKKAKKYMKYPLYTDRDRDGNSEAIYIKREINKNGVEQFVLMIYLIKPEEGIN